MLLGIVGSILGGLIGMALWRSDTAADTGFHPAGLIMSIIGAIVVLFIWRMIKGRSTV
jgi:uncharacterized membrane protein YeaQ/YmgE (transglycosylase-associated protein family)